MCATVLLINLFHLIIIIINFDNSMIKRSSCPEHLRMVVVHMEVDSTEKKTEINKLYRLLKNIM